jgi:hypothetical protein
MAESLSRSESLGRHIVEKASCRFSCSKKEYQW